MNINLKNEIVENSENMGFVETTQHFEEKTSSSILDQRKHRSLSKDSYFHVVKKHKLNTIDLVALFALFGANLYIFI